MTTPVRHAHHAACHSHVGGTLIPTDRIAANAAARRRSAAGLAFMTTLRATRTVGLYWRRYRSVPYSVSPCCHSYTLRYGLWLPRAFVGFALPGGTATVSPAQFFFLPTVAHYRFTGHLDHGSRQPEHRGYLRDVRCTWQVHHCLLVLVYHRGPAGQPTCRLVWRLTPGNTAASVRRCVAASAAAFATGQRLYRYDPGSPGRLTVIDSIPLYSYSSVAERLPHTSNLPDYCLVLLTYF